MLPPKKIPPKSFLSRRVVSDSGNHRGGISSALSPLSRLSQGEQREASCTPERLLLSARLSSLSVSRGKPTLSVHLSICLWSPVSVCFCVLTQLLSCLLVCLWSICLSDWYMMTELPPRQTNHPESILTLNNVCMIVCINIELWRKYRSEWRLVWPVVDTVFKYNLYVNIKKWWIDLAKK